MYICILKLIMIIMKHKILTLIALLFCACIIVYAQTSKKEAIIAFYNVENLFDTEDDPLTNDAEFLPTGKNQWTPERYQHKLENLATVISQIGQEKGGVVVIGVSEVENRKVLEDLAAMDKLKSLNLKVAHHDSPDRRGVDVAFLYNSERFKMLDTKDFLVVSSDTSFRTRDHFLMTGVIDKTDTIHLIVMHWPSKSGGEQRSLPRRIEAAQAARRIADSLLTANINANIIFMGDFNDNPTAKSVKEYLRPKVKIKDVQKGDLFNPMWKMYQDGIGTYAYRDNWDVIDQMIISSNLVEPAQTKSYKFVASKVFRKNFMITQSGSYTGYPFRTFAGGNYQGGYSDHFPVYIILEK